MALVQEIEKAYFASKSPKVLLISTKDLTYSDLLEEMLRSTRFRGMGTPTEQAFMGMKVVRTEDIKGFQILGDGL